MNSSGYQPWVHRAAVVTACVALLPITVGALVTTLNAGMAFLDWPTSDGYSMFLYPWLKSAGDKFVEHGHRLAGMLIGIVSIGLVAVVWSRESRRWVKFASVVVLLGVIAQGFLGGGRVRLDERVLALVHGSFAVVVFALMCGMALVTSRAWSGMAEAADSRGSRHLTPLAVFTTVLIFAQFLVGGTLRHLGMSLDEHIGLAFVVLVGVIVLAVASLLSQSPWLRRPACMLLALVLLQILLGGGAYVTKLGFPPYGYVAVDKSLPQVLFRTAHTLVGMFLFASSAMIALRIARLEYAKRRCSAAVVQNSAVLPAVVRGAAG